MQTNSVVEPYFISANELCFMNSNNIIIGFDINQKKETFNVTHCMFPGSQGKPSFETLIKTDDHVLGEDFCIYERKQIAISNKKNGSTLQVEERIAPNNFNCFLQERVVL